MIVALLCENLHSSGSISGLQIETALPLQSYLYGPLNNTLVSAYTVNFA
jgi:hypothetical protein